MASIARRYARALLEVATEPSSPAGQVDELGVQLSRLAATMKESEALRSLFLNPAYTREQRQATFGAVASALGLGESMVNLGRLLIDRARASELSEIARIYLELADERAGRARAQVWTASPLPPELAAKLGTALSQAVKRTVQVEAEVDPSLLGGAVAQVGSHLFDGSIKGRLRQLRRELKQA